MQDTLIRYLTMLSLIPREPRNITTERIKSLLEEDQYSISLRSIQRDLIKLSTFFPSLIGDFARPQRWCWKANAPQLSLPTLDPQTALTFHMVEQHMKPLLPAVTLSHLQPWFDAAAGVLSAQGNGLCKWPEKIRVLPQGLPRKSPSIDPEIHATVSQAVLAEKQLEITYKSVGALAPWTKILSPLGLVVRGGVIYLLCASDEYDEVRQFNLHRILGAVLLESSAIRPEGFDLNHTIGAGEMGIKLSAKKIKLEAYFSGPIGTYLAESPISEDQTLVDEEDGYVCLRATVPDTFELRQWLKSFGDEVIVTKPATLRREFRVMAETMSNCYRTEV
jgi:predicted DNA-binding transcriptional regulator YafY